MSTQCCLMNMICRSSFFKMEEWIELPFVAHFREMIQRAFDSLMETGTIILDAMELPFYEIENLRELECYHYRDYWTDLYRYPCNEHLNKYELWSKELTVQNRKLIFLSRIGIMNDHFGCLHNRLFYFNSCMHRNCVPNTPHFLNLCFYTRRRLIALSHGLLDIPSPGENIPVLSTGPWPGRNLKYLLELERYFHDIVAQMWKIKDLHTRLEQILLELDFIEKRKNHTNLDDFVNVEREIYEAQMQKRRDVRTKMWNLFVHTLSSIAYHKNMVKNNHSSKCQIPI